MNREVFMDQIRVNIGGSVTKIYVFACKKKKKKEQKGGDSWYLVQVSWLLGAEPFS